MDLNSLLIEMRLVGASLASTETEAFGVKLDTPIMLGNFGGYDKLGENARFQEAGAAVELNTLLWLNGHTSERAVTTRMEGGHALWPQICGGTLPMQAGGIGVPLVVKGVLSVHDAVLCGRPASAEARRLSGILWAGQARRMWGISIRR